MRNAGPFFLRPCADHSSGKDSVQRQRRSIRGDVSHQVSCFAQQGNFSHCDDTSRNRLTEPSFYATKCNVMGRNTWNDLSGLEELVMSHVWSSGSVTAEDVRTSLAVRHPMKDSTVRTILRRLESKGYLTHTVEGRTYLYRPLDPGESVAAQAVRRIVDRFCNGSIEQLLIGMVDNDVIDGKELERLARRIAATRETKRRKP